MTEAIIFFGTWISVIVWGKLTKQSGVISYGGGFIAGLVAFVLHHLLRDVPSFIWGIFLFIVAAATVAVVQEKIKSNDRKNMERFLGKIKNFSATQHYIGRDGNSCLAIDEQQKKICLITGNSTRVIPYKDIHSSEIFEDGITVTKTARASQIGGALIGGLALGGVGAIIGGLSGRTETHGKVKRIDLRITINDTTNPIYDVNFLDLETDKGSMVYEAAIRQARQWHAMLEVIIKRADLEDKATNAPETPNVFRGSVADELKKLVELHQSGVLTAEEFQQQKAKLLDSK